MSLPTNTRTGFNWSPVLHWLQKFGAFLTVAAIAIFGFWGGHFLLPGQEQVEPEPLGNPLIGMTSDTPVRLVTLTKDKLNAAKIQTAAITAGPFQSRKSMPGILVCDATRKVELRATVECMVKKILVQPAETVTAGQPILSLNGPEIGVSRNEIDQCQSSLSRLQQELEWVKSSHANIYELLEFLETSPTLDRVAMQFENKNLGEHRDEIITAYSELVLAQQLNENSVRLASQGVIPGNEASKRKSSYESAAAKFESIRERLKFQLRQSIIKAEADVLAEQKRLEVSQEKLSTLLGPHASQSAPPIGLTEFTLVAPRTGQISNLVAVESARFQPGEVMAEIADTSFVWLETQVSQSDWHSLSLSDNQQLNVQVAAFPGETFSATVRHLGTSVSSSTLSIPLIAAIDNSDGRLRPGMSVWAEVPTSKSHQTIAIPISAVQREAMQPIVFVKTGALTFEPKSIELGDESEGLVEVRSGLNLSDELVVEGAFYLKSELLLAEDKE